MRIDRQQVYPGSRRIHPVSAAAAHHRAKILGKPHEAENQLVVQLPCIGDAAPGHHPARANMFGIMHQYIHLAANLAAQLLNGPRVCQVQRHD